MSILVRLVQRIKAELLIVLTQLGRIILVRLEHSQKSAPVSSSVIPLGKSMLVRLEQPQNTPPEIFVTLSGIEILVRLEQPRKAFEPREVTLSGIVILVSFEQPSKAKSLTEVTPSAITALVKFGYVAESLTSKSSRTISLTSGNCSISGSTISKLGSSLTSILGIIIYGSDSGSWMSKQTISTFAS